MISKEGGNLTRSACIFEHLAIMLVSVDCVTRKKVDKSAGSKCEIKVIFIEIS